jgi:hypothetical protein
VVGAVLGSYAYHSAGSSYSLYHKLHCILSIGVLRVTFTGCWQSHVGNNARLTVPQDTSSTASTIKMQALVLLSAVLKVTSAQDWDAILPALTQPLLTALNERYYKVGLR